MSSLMIKLNLKCHFALLVAGQVSLQLAQQQFRITGAGGKPSTWLPPGRLVEHSRAYEIYVLQFLCEFWDISDFSNFRALNHHFREICPAKILMRYIVKIYNQTM
jgi:hypothetical protein